MIPQRPELAAYKAAIRAAVARKMTPSAAIPQFTVWREVHLDAANAERRGLSWTTVLLRAYAAALRDVPDHTSIIEKREGKICANSVGQKVDFFMWTHFNY
jgi:pyruvate/2-oxoglutarate dehydrogenase complex dihydrolipoamide acyltransferase (E2) component